MISYYAKEKEMCNKQMLFVYIYTHITLLNIKRYFFSYFKSIGNSMWI